MQVLSPLIAGIIKQNVAYEVHDWLTGKGVLINEEKDAKQLILSFALVPRKTGRHAIALTEYAKNSLKDLYPDLSIDGYTIDKLCRLWLLLQVNDSDKDNYIQKIESLFNSAEMNELTALYSALAFYKYPEHWATQCAEGIRSNIGMVLEAIMYANPYPSKYLNEQAWNQLVLKAFFTDKDVTRITDLDERANTELASILIDYARERRAAHRTINPQLWRLVSKYINYENLADIKTALGSNDIAEKNAAALTCYHSNYVSAKQLLNAEPVLLSAITDKTLNWNSL